MAFPAVTYTFSNGTTADATQVNQNFTDILNGLSDGTKALSVAAVTGSGVATFTNNVALGLSTSNTIAINGALTTGISFSANATYDIGASTLAPRSLYLGNSTFSIRLIAPTLAASYTMTLPTAVPTNTSLVQSDTSGTMSFVDKSTMASATNYLLNGNFDIWQRGTSTTIANTSTGYQADRWYVKNSLGTNGVITFSQITGVANGTLFGAKVQITTAPTVGQTNGTELYQTLENKDSILFYGTTASFSIRVKSFGNVNQVGVQFFYKTSEGKVDTGIGSEVLTSVNTSTFTQCTINGQSMGTTQTSAGVVGVRIRITAVSTGNTYDLNNGFVVEQAMMNLGTTAATFNRVAIAEELAKLYRYTFMLNPANANAYVATGQCTSTTAANIPLLFPTIMRATPTATGSGSFQITQSNGNQTGVSLSFAGALSPHGVVMTATGATSVVAGNATTLICAGGTATILFDAEI